MDVGSEDSTLLDRQYTPSPIVVKPRLEIEGWNQVCLGNACALQTAPAVSAIWKAYDLGSGGSTPVATVTGTTFAHTFSASGRYLITAEHPSHCSPATFTLTVKDPPPAPTADDLDPANRHTACPYGGIALSGSPSAPNYSLVWEPVCPTASPQLHSGDSVAIGYQAEVCDVRVYNYDRRLQCLSTDYYVHTVSPLVPDSVLIPSTITVCPGTSITWGTDLVPDQRSEGMLYEWTIEETMQYCASVQGSHLQPGVTLVVNNIPTPTTFYVRLRRSFCGGYVDRLIYINVVNTPDGALSISGPDTVCVGVSAHFTGTGGHSDTYRWYAESSIASSVDFDHAFAHSGTQTVRLTSREHDYCTNPDYLLPAQHTVHVFELPMVQGLHYNSYTHVVSVVPALPTTAYTFDWYIEPDEPVPASSFTGGNTTNASITGTYYCTVTDRATGCSRTVSLHVAMQQLLCNTISVTTGDFDYCNSSIQLQVNNTDINGNVRWSVRGGANTVETSGTHSRNATITVSDIGIYTVDLRFTYFGDCYKRTLYFTVDFLPEFTFEAACDRIIIHNNSRYADPAQNIQLRVYNSCSLLFQTLTFPASQRTYTYIPTPTPTGECTYSFSLYKYGNTLVDQPCTQGQVSIGVPSLAVGANPVSITLVNPYEPNKTCDNTPVELIASLNYSPATIVSSSWNFDDNSSYDVIGDRIHHTFANSQFGYYSVNVSSIDNHGCVQESNIPLIIQSFSNQLNSNGLHESGGNQCPYVGTITLTYSPHYYPGNHYTWESNPPSPVNTYATHHNGNYHLLVVNNNYCHRELAEDVFFLNAPTAFIFAESYTCCQGEEILLNGDAGPSLNNNLTYQWTITNSSGTTVQTGTSPTLRFSTNVAGTYTATLTVSNSVCSATAHATLTVQASPTPAPTISFGSTSCISDAPVGLQASGYSGTVYWSNGDTGPIAHYYAPGPVTAYYFDPAVGCASEKNTITIDAQPDLDALLTGCYEKCGDGIPPFLPVYSFPNEVINWEWYLGGGLLASGTALGNISPIQLPLTGGGIYQMELDYGVNCHETSPTLEIKPKKECECDSLTITYKKTKQEACPLSYTFEVTVCNNASEKVCLSKLDVVTPQESNFVMTNTPFAYLYIDPGECVTFNIDVDVFGLEPSVAWFSLYDECHNCEKVFSISLVPEVDCIKETPGKYDLYPDWSSSSASYFKFDITGTPSNNALACWSEPPMVFDWQNNAGNISGLGMVDVATLSQIVANNGDICIHVLLCNGELCDYVYCINANELYHLLEAYGYILNETEEQDKLAPPAGMIEDAVRLVPNPTSGMVDIVEADGDVVEAKVMDMHGRQVAVFSDASRFDISHLATGLYIVRVTTRDADDSQLHVHYLKLTKE